MLCRTLPSPFVDRRLFVSFLISCSMSIPIEALAQGKVFILTHDGFEKSAFLQKHKAVRKSNWPLKTGGQNFSYSFVDPEGTHENLSVELGTEPFLLTQLAVSFHGTSLRQPAAFSPRREQFLRDLLASTHPDISIEQVVRLVKSEQGRTYAGGSSQMPRIPVGNASVYVGTVGVSLIVGLVR